LSGTVSDERVASMLIFFWRGMANVAREKYGDFAIDDIDDFLSGYEAFAEEFMRVFDGLDRTGLAAQLNDLIVTAAEQAALNIDGKGGAS